MSIFHEKVAKGKLVLKNVAELTKQRMHRPEVVMTFFISNEDPIEDEAGSITTISSMVPPAHSEEMALKIQQDEKVQSFLKEIGFTSGA